MKLFDVYPLFDINIVKGKGCHVWVIFNKVDFRNRTVQAERRILLLPRKSSFRAILPDVFLHFQKPFFQVNDLQKFFLFL